MMNIAHCEGCIHRIRIADADGGRVLQRQPTLRSVRARGVRGVHRHGIVAAVAPGAAPTPAPTAAAAAVSTASRSVVVIGGGIGGLVVAGRLARAPGVKVTLLEQNDSVGGRCQSVERGGFRWDTGPSLLLFPETYREAYRSLGAELDDHLLLRRVEPAAYRVFFAPPESDSAGSAGAGVGGGASGGPKAAVAAAAAAASVPATRDNGAGRGGCGGGAGFTHLDLMYDVQRMAAQLEAAERGAGTEYLAWLADARRALVAGTDNFIARDARGFGDLLDPSRLLPLATRVSVPELLGQHEARLARRFADPRIRGLLSFQDLYVGLSPKTAPGVFSLLAATELTDGVFYPQGGFATVRDSLRALAERNGVEIRTRSRVARVRVGAAGRADGVELAGGGGMIGADAVVTNVDVATALGLVAPPPPMQASSSSSSNGNDSSNSAAAPAAAAAVEAAYAHAARRRARVEALDYSAGVIAYNFAVRRADLGPLLQHNVFLCGDPDKGWARAVTPEQLPRCPNFYVHVPSLTDPSAAPPGCHSVMALLPVANEQERRRALGSGSGGAAADDYEPIAAAGRAAVLNALAAAGAGDLSEPGAIADEFVITPPEWRARYGLAHGAAFGLAHGLSQLSLLRPGPEDARLPGLYFVGASARPGNGVPLCMISAAHCAGRVLEGLGLAARG